MERKYKILKLIIEEYIQNANPVGSTLIAEKYLQDVSSATIRNDMAELEAEGLIYQPHTSAGRIPSFLGYQFYLENLLEIEANQEQHQSLNQVKQEISANREGIKNLAKALAELSGEAVLIGFDSTDVYYTGISNLFKQPEFMQQSTLHHMSLIIDHLDEVMMQVFHEVSEEVKVLIGENNPFGELSSVVLAKYQLPTGSLPRQGLIGILGPSRMNYGRNINLINHCQNIIADLTV